MSRWLWKRSVLVSLLSIALPLLVWWLTRTTWLNGPAPTYRVAIQLIRSGQFDARVYDDAWYSAQVLAASNGAVSDLLAPSPPTLPVLLWPIGLLSDTTLNVTWAAANFAALLGAIQLSRATLTPRARTWLFALITTGALLSAPLYENLQRGQIYIFILLLHATVLWAAMQDRAVVAGVALGLLLALKINGWPLWIIWLALRRWRILFWATATVASITIATLPLIGVEVWRVYLTQSVPSWSSSAIATVPAYQTLSGFFQHLFRYDAEFNPAPLWDAPWLATLLSIGVSVGLLGISVARTKLPRPLLLGAGVILSAILSPLAEQYHYLILLVPLVAVAAISTEFNLSTRALFALAAVLIFVALPYKNPYWWNGAWALLAYPRLYGALILWGLLMFPNPSMKVVQHVD